MASESRGNRPAQLDRRPDEDRRDAPHREPPHPRPPPGGPRGEQPVSTQGPGRHPGLDEGGRRASHRPIDCLVSGHEDRRHRTPSLLGAAGSLHVPALPSARWFARAARWRHSFSSPPADHPRRRPARSPALSRRRPSTQVPRRHRSTRQRRPGRHRLGPDLVGASRGLHGSTARGARRAGSRACKRGVARSAGSTALPTGCRRLLRLPVHERGLPRPAATAPSKTGPTRRRRPDGDCEHPRHGGGPRRGHIGDGAVRRWLSAQLARRVNARAANLAGIPVDLPLRA